MPYTNPEDKKKNRLAYIASGRSLEKQREWTANNREKVNSDKRAAWKKLKADAGRYEKHKASRRSYRIRSRIELLNRYGGKCACCGEVTFEFLGFDHINGGGRAERKSFSSGSIFNTTLRKGRTDIRVLCHNCNLARGFYGTCPHERHA